MAVLIPEIPLAQSIIQIFKEKGINNIIISPGSRNAPLTIGFASDSFFNCYSITDERVAAFFALGIAQQTQKPVALVCTSGSALLNYYPAIAEAFYSQIPLIVLSADRPQNKIDIGDGQTIRQQNVFDNHIVFNVNLTEEASKTNDEKICSAIDFSLIQKGPVHINCPFEEPLYNTLSKYTYLPEIKSIKNNKKEQIDFIYYAEKWKNSSKKLILIGCEYPEIISKNIAENLANDPSIIVLHEVQSNVHHSKFIAHIDQLITNFSEDDFKTLQPELLITFGGMVVSKRIKTFLRQYQPKAHWHIDEIRAYDTYNCLSEHIKTTPSLFFERMNTLNSVESSYQDKILSIFHKIKEKHNKIVENAPFSDLKVFSTIWKHLPKNSLLQISNSSPIRYAQLFPTDSSISVYCNRGTSGIDGSTSTAIGAAVSSNKLTTFITGDISFFYDSNALWNSYTPKNFKLILINNGGGGIFRILPGHKENALFNTFFETEHQLNASHLANMYGWKYLKATDKQTMEQKLQELYKHNDCPTILEIFTPTKTNQDILKNYFKSINHNE